MRVARLLIKIPFLLCLGLFVRLAHGAISNDSLTVLVYQKGEAPHNLPKVFPQARPFTLLLHARTTIPHAVAPLQCANLFAAAHRLAGLQYYSHSEGAMRTLFKESAVLAHPRSRTPLVLPAFRKLPLDTTFYIRQIDNRIGELIYRATLRADSASASLFLYNVHPATKFGVQLVESGDFLLYIAVQRRANETLELQAWQWQRFKDGLLGLFIKEASFVNRLKAVAGFYQKALVEK